MTEIIKCGWLLKQLKLSRKTKIDEFDLIRKNFLNLNFEKYYFCQTEGQESSEVVPADPDVALVDEVITKRGEVTRLGHDGPDGEDLDDVDDGGDGHLGGLLHNVGNLLTLLEGLLTEP